VSWIWRMRVILPPSTVKCSATRSLPTGPASRSYSSIAWLPSLIAASSSTLLTMDPKLSSAAANDSAVG